MVLEQLIFRQPRNEGKRIGNFAVAIQPGGHVKINQTEKTDFSVLSNHALADPGVGNDALAQNKCSTFHPGCDKEYPPDRTQGDEIPKLGKCGKGMVTTKYKHYLARIPKMYTIIMLGYSANVYDIVPITARDRAGVDPTPSRYNHHNDQTHFACR